MGLFNTTNTSTVLGNTGLQSYTGTTGKWKYIVLVPKNTEIATHTLGLTQSTWTNGLNAAIGSRWFILPMIFNGTPEQEETVKETSDFGYESLVRDGKLTYKIDFEEISVYNKTQLFKLNNGDFDAFIITDKDFILGWTPDSTKVRAIQFDYQRVLPETQNTGTTNARVQFELRTTDIRQLNEMQVALDCINDVLVPSAWYPSLVLPAAAIKDLVVNLTALTATAFSFNLFGYDGVAYSAAVKEDIYLRKTTEDGTLIAITSITETATKGYYTGVIGTQTSGTFYLSLLDQPTATTEGVETPVVSSYAATI